jgi:TatA/E family protein of Tat protein translocase
MLSIPHLIIIFIVALVVFGPQKLPELARNLGKIMAEFRRATGDLRSTFDEHMRELERESQAIEVRKHELEVREAAVRLAQSAALAQPPETTEAAPQTIAVPAGAALIEVAPAEVESTEVESARGIAAEAETAEVATPEVAERGAAVGEISSDSIVQESSPGSK